LEVETTLMPRPPFNYSPIFGYFPRIRILDERKERIRKIDKIGNTLKTGLRVMRDIKVVNFIDRHL